MTETSRFCDALLRCGALELLAKAATTPGLRSATEARITPFSVHTDAIAHEQYCLLWSGLSQVCSHSTAAGKTVVDCGLLKILLMYVDKSVAGQQVRSTIMASQCAAVCLVGQRSCIILK